MGKTHVEGPFFMGWDHPFRIIIDCYPAPKSEADYKERHNVAMRLVNLIDAMLAATNGEIGMNFIKCRDEHEANELAKALHGVQAKSRGEL